MSIIRQKIEGIIIESVTICRCFDFRLRLEINFINSLMHECYLYLIGCKTVRASILYLEIHTCGQLISNI